MKRRELEAAADPASREFPDGTWAKALPRVCEYLSDPLYEDGKERELASVSISLQEGVIVAALNDKDTRASLYRSGSTVLEALKSLEKALEGDKADWRAWGGAKAKKK